MRLFCMTLLFLSLATASLAETVHCTTREEPAFKRWVTTCTDGACSITRWNQAFKRWDTEIVTPSKSRRPPPGLPLPGKPPR
jgi:hypothetical protein